MVRNRVLWIQMQRFSSHSTCDEWNWWNCKVLVTCGKSYFHRLLMPLNCWCVVGQKPITCLFVLSVFLSDWLSYCLLWLWMKSSTSFVLLLNSWDTLPSFHWTELDIGKLVSILSADFKGTRKCISRISWVG